jgi:fimbrial chaperone protein
MKRHILGLATLLLAMGGLTEPAAAFRLIPIEMNFEPSGRGATQIFRLENDAQTPVAVEISIIGRGQDVDGEDVKQSGSDDWVIFPEQLILEPGQNQSVRVQWIGTATPERELPFRLIAEQLPIDIGQAPVQGGQVRLLVQYKASLYVVPPGAKPKLTVLSAGPTKLSDGGTVLELRVENNGTAHQILRDPTLTLQAGGRSVSVKADQLGGLAGENLLAGVTRRFLLPWPKELPTGPLTATIDLP